MKTYPKYIEKQLKALSKQAHERELAQALSELAQTFNTWQSGELSASELALFLHEYDTDVLQEIDKLYNRTPQPMQVAHAIAQGFLKEEEISEEIWPYLQVAIEFYRDCQDETEANTA